MIASVCGPAVTVYVAIITPREVSRSRGGLGAFLFALVVQQTFRVIAFFTIDGFERDHVEGVLGCLHAER